MMAREDFSLLSDDEVRSALHEGAMRLAIRLSNRARGIKNCPKIDMEELEEFCLKRLAERHGVSHLFAEQEAD